MEATLRLALLSQTTVVPLIGDDHHVASERRIPYVGIDKLTLEALAAPGGDIKNGTCW